MALGQLRLELEYYYSLTPVQFFNTVEGFFELENARQRISWESARLVAQVVAQVNSKKTIKPTDIAVFPWEVKISETIDVDAERKRIKENNNS